MLLRWKCSGRGSRTYRPRRESAGSQRAGEAEAKRKAEEEAARKAAEEAARAQIAAEDRNWHRSSSATEREIRPYEGQVAVGAVIMNRVEVGVYPNSISEVIYQSGQFGPAMTGWLDTVRSSEGYAQTAMQAAADAIMGVNPIGDCLYFGNGNYGIQIGDHFFHFKMNKDEKISRFTGIDAPRGVAALVGRHI